MKHIIEIHRNAEGSKLAFMGVKGGGCCYRIAGPKAWGGSQELASIEVKDSDLVRYIQEYAPHIIKELKEIDR
jgi:hypothetical protein